MAAVAESGAQQDNVKQAVFGGFDGTASLLGVVVYLLLQVELVFPLPQRVLAIGRTGRCGKKADGLQFHRHPPPTAQANSHLLGNFGFFRVPV